MISDFYAVGKSNQKLRTGDIQLRCEYIDGIWTLYALLPKMTTFEALNIQTGRISLAFAVIEDELFLIGKLGELEWFDMPYEPARYAEPQEYINFGPQMGAPVVIIGADSNTGTVRALRSFALSNAMSNALHTICRDMDIKHRPLNIAKQNTHIQEIYRKFPDSVSMLRCANPEHLTIIA